MQIIRYKFLNVTYLTLTKESSKKKKKKYELKLSKKYLLHMSNIKEQITFYKLRSSW